MIPDSAIDILELAKKLKRLTAWLDVNCQPESLIRRQFRELPFGEAYATIDPDRQGPAASFNYNRVYLCGRETGLEPSGVARFIELFAEHGVKRFFVWLSPGSDMDMARRWLTECGFTRVKWTGYPTLHRRRASPFQVRTDLAIREVDANEIASARTETGELMWAQHARSAGKEGFFHFMAFDGKQPVAIASLCLFEELGYLMAASTAEEHRGRGAQQALIAARIARAEQLGHPTLVSETLYMLEHSWRNLQRAGFEEIYEKEVFEWSA